MPAATASLQRSYLVFLNETVRQAIDHKVIKSKTIVDSTHSRSKHTPQTPTQILREMTKNWIGNPFLDKITPNKKLL